MVEALVGIGRDETASIYVHEDAAPLVADAIFSDYVRRRLAALRDHYAVRERPASDEALLFAAIADCESAILGTNVRIEPPYSVGSNDGLGL